MKIDKVRVRCYPSGSFRLISMNYDLNRFCYSVLNTELFEVYHYRSIQAAQSNKHSYSRGYVNHRLIPDQYLDAYNFLKQEFNKIDWESLLVLNALTGKSKLSFEEIQKLL